MRQIRRAIAILRERYGFTASESLEMSVIEFEEWLEALTDSDGEGTSDEDEVWENMGGK